jgi:hypothetical protein
MALRAVPYIGHNPPAQGTVPYRSEDVVLPISFEVGIGKST